MRAAFAFVCELNSKSGYIDKDANRTAIHTQAQKRKGCATTTLGNRINVNYGKGHEIQTPLAVLQACRGLRVLPRILEQLPRHDHHLTTDPSGGLWIPFVAGCMMGVALHPWPILLTALIDSNNIYMVGGAQAANVWAPPISDWE